jgi:hypothetical protein
MTHIATAILEILKTNSTIHAIVADRIYPDALPYISDLPPTLPALVVVHVSGTPDTEVPDFSSDRVQVSCFSNPQEVNGISSPLEVEQLAQAVKDALHTPDLKKSPLSQTVSGVSHCIFQIRMTGERRFREGQTGYYHIPLDFMVSYRKD